MFTAWDWHLVPELGPHPGEGLGLGHGQGDLDSLHQHLDVLRVREVSRMEDWFVIWIVAPKQDPPPGLWSEQHGNDRPGVPVGQRAVHLPHGVTYAVRLQRVNLSVLSRVCGLVMIWFIIGQSWPTLEMLAAEFSFPRSRYKHMWGVYTDKL